MITKPPSEPPPRCPTCGGSGYVFVPPDGVDLCTVHPAIVPYITTLRPCPACQPATEE